MHTNTLQAKEARTFLESLAASTTGHKMKLRGATFRENTDGTADKFVGVLTIEVRTINLGRWLVAVRVYGARGALKSSMRRHATGESLQDIAEDIIPGLESPDLTPFRIGGVQVCYCLDGDPHIIARETLAEYSFSYMQSKSLRGYRVPNAQQGGSTGTFLKCMGEAFDLSGNNWQIAPHSTQIPNHAGASIQPAALVWGEVSPTGKAKPFDIVATPQPKTVMDVGSMFLSPRKRITITRPKAAN